ncbi:Sec-independent protein translocase subunit TatA/TatB [Microbacterium phyllosphaerae]|uniref:Sec-independent protein translocase subunit TatA/TatB n=1 Tax=Microbacterium phyllosphaerae TaxID=124798 RepID=UPI002168F726|nr:twin-arginine translocase TatA/TatE family subunit [Microbacterium phyllosphaerae]MCS3442521.1 sec-independent protein translocase protein TatB [Microbacterium phyllosphaerae]
MFGLTIEKLFLVAVLAAVVIGPRGLPEYAGRLGALIRRLTVLAGDATRRAEQETGVAAIRQDWTALDPRQYDPRRIIREAWAASDAEGSTVEAASSPAEVSVPAMSPPDVPEGECSAPAGSWVMAGSSGHPRRVWVPEES